MSDAITVQQHYVTFYSPGTFVAEETQRPIEAWDVERAKEMARTVLERHGATPYGFRFTTRGRTAVELNSREIAKSPFYWLGGKVETLAEVKARATEKDRILVSNMEGNGYDRIITNDNSWRWTSPLDADDVVLEWDVPVRVASERSSSRTTR
jgi:isochorismate hydrolase